MTYPVDHLNKQILLSVKNDVELSLFVISDSGRPPCVLLQLPASNWVLSPLAFDFYVALNDAQDATPTSEISVPHSHYPIHASQQSIF